MRVWAANWHTPFWFMWRKAMPADVHLYLSPTPHAPTGWREDQRPFPLQGVSITAAPDAGDDVAICQTEMDFSTIHAHETGPALIFLGHNKPQFEPPSLIERLNWIKGGPGGAHVTISPMKCAAWKEAVPDDWRTVLPYVDVNDYGGWTGEGGYVLTVANNLRRPLFDVDAWIEATRGLPVKLVGEGNEGIPGAVGPAKDWDELRRYYREATAYLSVNKWPNEDGYNLALLEAAATGMPCFTLAQYPPGTDSTPQWTCMRFDAGIQMRGSLAYALQGVRDIDREQGAYERECVARDFPMTTFREKWLTVLNEVTK